MSFSGENLVLIAYAMLKSAVIFRNEGLCQDASSVFGHYVFTGGKLKT